MKIVLPIFFAAVFMGLFAKRVTPRHWFLLILWILLISAWNYHSN